MSRIGHTTRRHPLCPRCRYDLVATIDAGRNVCPECGCEFQPHELKRQRLAEDWTIGRGLGRASGVLFLRALPCLVGWVIVLWGVTVPAAWLAGGRNWRIVIIVYGAALLLLVAASGAIGRVLAQNMDEIAGMTSLIVAALITAFAWAALIGGTLIVQTFTPLTANAAYGATTVACGFSLFIIVKTHFFDEF